MAISEHKSVSAGAGVSILTAIASIFSTYLRAHPVYLYAGGIVGVALIVWPFLHPLWAKRKAAETPSPSKTQVAGGDVSGKMFQAENLHYHEAAAPKPESAPPTPTLTRRQSPEPNVVAVGVKRFVIPYNGYGNFGLPKGDAVWVLEIRNRHDEVPISEATSVFASLEFRGLYDSVEIIQRAAWYKHEHFEIEIPIENVEQVVLGYPTEKRDWITYNNSRQFELVWSQRGRGNYDTEPLTEVPIPVRDLTVEIKVFSRHRQVRYLRKRYRLSFRDVDGQPAFEEIQ
jgi:hypothetical protein